MGRKVLAVVVALIVAAAIFLVVQIIATMFPDFAPKNLEYMSISEREAYFSHMPMGAYITITPESSSPRLRPDGSLPM